jgi:hypothetical protein
VAVGVATVGLAALALAGCQRDPSDLDGPKDGFADVTFSVSVEGDQSTPTTTRALSSDTDVENIELLIFEGGYLKERKTVERASIIDNGQYKTFTTRLSLSPVARMIWIVANDMDAGGGRRTNATDNIGIPLGSTEEHVAKSLGMRIAAENERTMTPLIMWGKIPSVVVNQSEVVVRGVKLLRVAAKVTIKKSASPSLANFEIQGISARGVEGDTQIAPFNWNGWTNENAATPSQPNRRSLSGMPISFQSYYCGPLASQEWWATGGDPLYVYEKWPTDQLNGTTPEPIKDVHGYTIEEPMFYIRATYDGTTCYYKLQLRDVLGERIYFIRNHNYIVNIVSVKGPGYRTLQDAIDGPDNSHELDVIVDEHRELVAFAADGNNYIGVSTTEVVYINEGGASSPSTVFALAYLSSGNRPVASWMGPSGQNNIFNLGTSVLDAGTGLWRIVGTTTGVAGTGRLRVQDGDMYIDIDVTTNNTSAWSPKMSGGATWKVDPAGSIPLGTTWWEIEILPDPAPSNVLMNYYPASTTINQLQQPSVNPPTNYSTNWGVKAISSETVPANNKVCLFVPDKNPAYNATIKCSYIDSGGNLVVSNYILRN